MKKAMYAEVQPSRGQRMWMSQEGDWLHLWKSPVQRWRENGRGVKRIGSCADRKCWGDSAVRRREDLLLKAVGRAAFAIQSRVPRVCGERRGAGLAE